jgi:inosine/xanthosine triphosphate pyrophosphatase family protein
MKFITALLNRHKQVIYIENDTGRAVEMLAASGGMPGCIIVRWLDTQEKETIASDKFDQRFAKRN